MTKVNTVLGTIPAEELDIVAVHEHIGYGMPGSELDTKWWKTPEQAYEETVPKLRKFHEYGGGTFVDATGICNGRDVDYYKSLSAKTGVHIVACTGFVGGDTALPHFARATVDYLAQGVHPRDHRRHRQHRRQGRRHQGRREPRRTHDGPRQAHLPRRGPRRRRHRRADPDPPGHRSRTGRDHLQRRGPFAGPRALRPRRRRPQRPITPHDWIYEQGGRIGFDTFGYDLELPDPPFWGRKRAERMEHFVNLREQGLLRTSSSSRPTPTAARWAGRASRATPSTTSSRT